MKHRATYQGHTNSWRGVVKDADGNVVAICRHLHHNRDGSSMTWGQSARSCATTLLAYVDPESLPAWMRPVR